MPRIRAGADGVSETGAAPLLRVRGLCVAYDGRGSSTTSTSTFPPGRTAWG